MSKNESLLAHTAKSSVGWANKASALRATKFTVIAGKTLGVTGIFLTAGEDFLDGKAGVGTFVKIGIGLATTFIAGPAIVAYSVADIARSFIFRNNYYRWNCPRS